MNAKNGHLHHPPLNQRPREAAHYGAHNDPNGLVQSSKDCLDLDPSVRSRTRPSGSEGWSLAQPHKVEHKSVLSVIKPHPIHLIYSQAL